MDLENEDSEDGEFESIRVPILNAETTKYDKTFFLKATNVFCDEKECNGKNISNLLENYANIPEKSKNQYFERDSQAIRWKYEENSRIASNARLIEWSDGSLGVQIGSELYDLIPGDINDTKVFSVYKNTLFIAQDPIKQKALCKLVKKD